MQESDDQEVDFNIVFSLYNRTVTPMSSQQPGWVNQDLNNDTNRYAYVDEGNLMGVTPHEKLQVFSNYWIREN